MEEHHLLLVVTDGHWPPACATSRAPAAPVAGAGSLCQPDADPVQVQPPLVAAKREGQGPELSETAAESIRGSAEGISDPSSRQRWNDWPRTPRTKTDVRASCGL
jgi:hypothetical protein